MGDPVSSSEKEFSELVDEWKECNGKLSYDLENFLKSAARIFEKETHEFHKGDPDPFDERHPEYAQPGCTFGKLLVSLTKNSDLMEKLISTYIRDETNDKTPSPVAIATARLLLAASPGIELQALCKEREWLVKLLFKWSTNAEEPLRTYSTGLLVDVVEPQKTSNEEYLRIISILLKRLWNHVRPGKFPEAELGNSLNKVEKKQDYEQNFGANNTSRNTTSKKRKLSGDSSTSIPKKVSVERPTVGPNMSKANGFIKNDTSSAENFYDNDLSNSSWSEQMPVMLGCNYSLEPPLSSSVCQGFILDFLRCLGEYQDLLSIFIELKALDLINVYLKERKSDGLLTFKVLKFLASLLCHNKVATEFIELNGIQTLLSVHRPSMGSTGVSLCLYYLAYKKDAMERVCQLPARVLSEMVKYAIWLLECSHDVGRSHAALFFSISFSFKVILNLFDRMNGLRCLINMISTSKPIINSLDATFDPEEDTNKHFIRQTTRTVCAALKKYFEAHLQIRACASQKTFPKSKQRNLQAKPMVCSREQFFEYLEVLSEIQEEESNEVRCLNNWPAISTFCRLDGVQLMLKVIDIASDWSGFPGLTEIIRSVLDVLAVVTLSRSTQLLLTKQHALDKKLSGVGVVLSFLQGGFLFTVEGEARKSALAIVVNCVGGHVSQKESSQKNVRATPKHKAKQRKGKEALWKCIQYNNGIQILLNMFVETQPALHVVELRHLACKALLGLSNYKPVRQILSKLPFFVNGQIQSLAKEPVLNDKKRVQKKFCKCLEALLEKVSGKPMSLDLDLDSMRKSHIVSETNMQYDNKEVLLMIHNHLMWSKLPNAAEALAREACLLSSENSSIFATPKSRGSGILRASLERRTDNDGGGDASSAKVSRRISFSRGDHASGETPTPSSVINITASTSQKKALRFKNDTLLGYANSTGQRRFKLSNTGVVSVKSKSVMRPSQDPPSPPTLNSIIEENFKHQHAKCRNPVVTVPEFSLFSKHCCPEPRYRVEAPVNVTRRASLRQGICPRWGGVGGAGCDRQLVYSRYKPGYVIKGAEDRKIPFTSVAFMPDNEQVILGDDQGDIVMHTMYSNEDQVVQGVASSTITFLEPSRNGSSILITSESFWSGTCNLHASGDRLEHKFTYEGMDYVEFSKLHQDKVLGTKDHKATVFDTNSGQILDTFEREDMASMYQCNRATFSPDDKLILSDGLLWDVRRPHGSPIHKFDRFNYNISGVFHPNGLEVIINTEVWDLRNYHLLHSVPAFDQCDLVFNDVGSTIYAVRKKNPSEEDAESNKAMMSAFRTFDAFEYKQLAFIATRHQICDLAVDSVDFNVAVVETMAEEDRWRDHTTSVCRFYEVGMSRGDEDDEEESNYGDHSSDGSSSSNEDNASSQDNEDDAEFGIDDLLSEGDSSIDLFSADEEDLLESEDWVTTDEDVSS